MIKRNEIFIVVKLFRYQFKSKNLSFYYFPLLLKIINNKYTGKLCCLTGQKHHCFRMIIKALLMQ